MPVCSVYSEDDDWNSSQESFRGAKLGKKHILFWVANSLACGKRIHHRVFGMGIGVSVPTRSQQQFFADASFFGIWLKKFIEAGRWVIGIKSFREISNHKKEIKTKITVIILTSLRNSCWSVQSCGSRAMHAVVQMQARASPRFYVIDLVADRWPWSFCNLSSFGVASDCCSWLTRADPDAAFCCRNSSSSRFSILRIEMLFCSPWV